MIIEGFRSVEITLHSAKWLINNDGQVDDKLLDIDKCFLQMYKIQRIYPVNSSLFILFQSCVSMPSGLSYQ